MKRVHSLWLSLAVCAALHAADGPAIEFLDVAMGQKAIIDESMEPYFKLLQTREMSAKTGEKITGETLDAQRDEARRRYQANVLEFSGEEKKSLRSSIEMLHPILQKHYPKFAALPWKFIKVGDKLEAGFPHTRGECIVFPQGVFDQLFARTVHRSNLDQDAEAKDLAPLLLHEQMHVFQRKNPSLFVPLFEAWGFEYVKEIPAGDWLTRQQLRNPDGVDLGWIFPIKDTAGDRYVWPLVLLAEREGEPVMRRDFMQVSVQLEKTAAGYQVKNGDQGKPVLVPLQAETGYTRRVPRVGSLYHPNEICAEAFSLAVMADHMDHDRSLPGAEDREKNLKTFREWAQKSLR